MYALNNHIKSERSPNRMTHQALMMKLLLLSNDSNVEIFS